MVKMAKTISSLTKITAPQAYKPFLRPRLFDRLNQLGNKTVIWLLGPPGAGKTTLASTFLSNHPGQHLWYQIDADDANIATFFHYFRTAIQQAIPGTLQKLPVLSPEYLPGLTTFIRRYADIIGTEFKKPTLIIFDNYEQLPIEAPLHEVLRDLVSYLPPGISVLVLSRTEPPPVFARLQLHGHLAILDSSELNLTPDEAVAFAWALEPADNFLPDLEHIERAFEETHGWITGFSLLLAASRDARNEFSGLYANHHVVFDYFATELFRHFSAHVQHGLICVALLPTMTIKNIERITGGQNLAKVLADLQRRNCFVVQRGQSEPEYEYHALFRAFLLNQAKLNITEQDWRNLQQTAADLLADSHQSDAAATLYRSIKDWPGLVKLIFRDGQDMISAGRHHTLEQWINCLPADAFKQTPWLFYWHGMARLPFNPVEARNYLEQAYAGFSAEDNVEGLYLAWAAVMDTFFYEWQDLRPADRWIMEFEALRARHPDFTCRAVEMRTYWAMGTLLHRQPQHPFIPVWAERAEAILNVEDLELSVLLAGYLVIYHLWRGDSAKAQEFISRVDPWTRYVEFPALVSILWSCANALFYSVRGDLHNCLKIIEDGLSLAEKTGLHCWDFLLSAQAARCSLVAGKLEVAKNWMTTMATTMRNHSHINGGFLEHLQSNAAAQQGKWPSAVEHARKGLIMAIDAGVPFLEGHCRIDLARALIGLGELAEWPGHLDIADSIGLDMRSKVLQYLCLETRAYAAFQCNDIENERTLLAQAFTLGLEMGEPIWQMAGPQVTGKIYQRALTCGIETEHVRQLIRLRRLMPTDPATAPDQWPWPVHIVSLGRFEILLEDAPLHSSRKAQHKVLELIKVLCAFGGQSIHQERVTDALWPDAEADAADQTLNTTLHRLRKLLQNEQVVRLEDRQLSLDFRYIWVDALAFERIACQSPKTDRTSLKRALSYYRGHFLAGESAAWALVFRERLRSKFLKLSEHYGALLEQDEDWPTAINSYNNVIDIEPVAEVIYRRLMICHVKLGQRADAIFVYQRCRQALLTHLGVSPSQETQHLYQQLLTS